MSLFPSDGIYRVVNRATNAVLHDTSREPITARPALAVFQPNAHEQLWRVTSAKGTTRLQNIASDLYLSLAEADGEAWGGAMRTTANQRWILNSRGENRYTLKCEGTNSLLTHLGGGNRTVGRPAAKQPVTGSDEATQRQEWSFDRLVVIPAQAASLLVDRYRADFPELKAFKEQTSVVLSTLYIPVTPAQIAEARDKESVFRERSDQYDCDDATIEMRAALVAHFYRSDPNPPGRPAFGWIAGEMRVQYDGTTQSTERMKHMLNLFFDELWQPGIYDATFNRFGHITSLPQATFML